jgi:hypothetical protein
MSKFAEYSIYFGRDDRNTLIDYFHQLQEKLHTISIYLQVLEYFHMDAKLAFWEEVEMRLLNHIDDVAIALEEKGIKLKSTERGQNKIESTRKEESLDESLRTLKTYVTDHHGGT